MLVQLLNFYTEANPNYIYRSIYEVECLHVREAARDFLMIKKPNTVVLPKYGKPTIVTIIKKKLWWSKHVRQVEEGRISFKKRLLLVSGISDAQNYAFYRTVRDTKKQDLKHLIINQNKWKKIENGIKK